MDNSNSLSSAILQSSEASLPSLNTGSSSSSSSGGIFDSLKEINATTWVIIILILYMSSGGNSSNTNNNGIYAVSSIGASTKRVFNYDSSLISWSKDILSSVLTTNNDGTYYVSPNLKKQISGVYQASSVASTHYGEIFVPEILLVFNEIVFNKLILSLILK